MACRRRALLLALITAASAFIRPVSHLRTARSIDVAAKKKRKGKPAAGGLQSLKVPQLKEKCRAAGLPVGGTKAVLIERLQAATAPAAAAAPAPAAAPPAAGLPPPPAPRSADTPAAMSASAAAFATAPAAGVSACGFRGGFGVPSWATCAGSGAFAAGPRRARRIATGGAQTNGRARRAGGGALAAGLSWATWDGGGAFASEAIWLPERISGGVLATVGRVDGATEPERARWERETHGAAHGAVPARKEE